MTLFISIVLLSIMIVHGQDYDEDESNNHDSGILDELREHLNDFFPGNTYLYDFLSNITSEISREGDTYQFRFSPDISTYMGERLLIGELTQVKTIVRVQITFYGDNDNAVCDDSGDPIQYTSTRHALGHILDILHRGFSFSYAKCLLTLLPGRSFNLQDLFFHFAQLSSTGTNQTGVITGPNSFSIDLIGRMYNVSIPCPNGATCMWYLDNYVINSTSSTSVILIFKPENVGNRTLSYAKIISNNPLILASLLLSILPSTIQVCNNLPKNPKNIWLPAGSMSSPRVYFTATYLKVNQFVLIAGGTADGSTPLSSFDIYDPDTGCYNTLNMTVSRMKHAAVYFNTSDIVLVMGGLGAAGSALQLAEFVSINGSYSGPMMDVPRYSQAIAVVNDSNILIVAGKGFNVTTAVLEMYERSTSTFEMQGLNISELMNLVGHSVTSLGTSGTAFIFGGYNGTGYPGIAFLTDGTNFTNATTQDIDTILGRAHHNAIYIPECNSVLITGGHNGTHVFRSCFLYDVHTENFREIDSMSLQRAYHTAVRLSNGSILIIGGAVSINNGQPNTPTGVVERFDPKTRKFTTVANLNYARYGHASILHNAYEVFVFGGFGGDNIISKTVEFLMVDYLTE